MTDKPLVSVIIFQLKYARTLASLVLLDWDIL